jgi:hypothetical protein
MPEVEWAGLLGLAGEEPVGLGLDRAPEEGSAGLARRSAVVAVPPCLQQ